MKNTIKILILFVMTYTLVSCQSLLESIIKKWMQDQQEKQEELLKSNNMHVFLK